MKHPLNQIKKVEWHSDRHDNLTDDVRMAENKASAERDHCRKADKKLAQANSKITELDAKLTELQQELAALQMPDKRTPINQGNLYISWVLIQNPLLANQARNRRRAKPSH